MITTIFFDLFFTLTVPVYDEKLNEYSILNLTAEEWEFYAENDSLYNERALGKVTDENEIIKRIVEKIPFEITVKQQRDLLKARICRMKNALNNISSEIINTLKIIKQNNFKLGLISNADRIDCKYWLDSTLATYFDDAVFSCNEGMMKPDHRIYNLAMNRLGAAPENCLFVGDGGSDELLGAKESGMKTVFTEFLDKKKNDSRDRIIKYADYQIQHFNQIWDILKSRESGTI